MTRNPILDELRRTREELLANAGGTMAGLVAQLQRDEQQSGRQVLKPVDLPRNRKKECAAAGDDAVPDMTSCSATRLPRSCNEIPSP
ncbi:MAG: hypothetical protein JWM11_4765 [Planctomycetaceae bacterium]|nr:hypothetical protein [Planctomycetaceae bacterium]